MTTVNVRVLTLFLALTLSARSIHGYSAGPPATVCVSMSPGHNVTAQTTTPPFTVTPSSLTYTAGQTITVNLTATDSVPFLGFMLQARAGTTQVGTFTVPAGLNVVGLTCNTTNGSVTHTTGFNRTVITLTWTAPATTQGTLQFRATVVRAKVTFWEGVLSANISAAASTTAATTASTTAAVTSTAAPTTGATTTTLSTTTAKASNTTNSAMNVTTTGKWYNGTTEESMGNSLTSVGSFVFSCVVLSLGCIQLLF